MRLYHYSAKPVTKIKSVPWRQRGARWSSDRDTAIGDKPKGFWVSDDDADWNWPVWCRANDFQLERLTWRQEVILSDHAHILFLRSIAEIDALTREYGEALLPGSCLRYIDWMAVCRDKQGIVITPYQWERRLDPIWYYGWDCACGCIWDAEAVALLGSPERVG